MKKSIYSKYFENRPASCIAVEVSADYALFTNPLNRELQGGYFRSLPYPTPSVCNGIMQRVLSSKNPPIFYQLVAVRIMNDFTKTSEFTTTSVESNNFSPKQIHYNYLKDPLYQLIFKIVSNNGSKLDRNTLGRMKSIIAENIVYGNVNHITLGKGERCEAKIKLCNFGEGKGFYDGSGVIDFGKNRFIGMGNDVLNGNEKKSYLRYSNLVMIDGRIQYPDFNSSDVVRVDEDNR